MGEGAELLEVPEGSLEVSRGRPRCGWQTRLQVARMALKRGWGTCLLVLLPAPSPRAISCAPGWHLLHPPPSAPPSSSLTHSLNGEVKGQHGRQRGRGLAQQVDNPHAACIGPGSGGAGPHLLGREQVLGSGLMAGLRTLCFTCTRSARPFSFN